MIDDDGWIPIEVRIVRAGDARLVAWRAPWGSGCATLRELRREATQRALFVGDAGAGLDAPHVVPLAGRHAVLACDASGVVLHRYDGADLGSPRRDLAGARSLAVGIGFGESHVFAEDGESIRIAKLTRAGALTVAPEPFVRQSGRAVMASAKIDVVALLFASWADDGRLLIADAERGASSIVRHVVPGIETIDALAAGNRAAFALGLGGAPDHVLAGLVDRDVKLVERPDVVLRVPGGVLERPRVAWIANAFHVFARDAKTGAIHLAPLASGRGRVIAKDVAGPFDLTLHADTLTIAEAAVRADEVRIRLHESDLEGRGAQVVDVTLEPPPEVRRLRAQQRADQCLDQFASHLAGSPYRGASDREGPSVRAGDVVVTLVPEADRLLLTWHELADAASAASSTWWRRLSASARAQRASDLARARQMAAALAAELVRADRSAHGLQILFRLERAPHGSTLASWLPGRSRPGGLDR